MLSYLCSRRKIAALSIAAGLLMSLPALAADGTIKIGSLHDLTGGSQHLRNSAGPGPQARRERHQL